MNLINIFWFRRDLRLEDNRGLKEALGMGLPVLPVFIFDTGILNKLEDKSDRRVDYIHGALTDMQQRLKARQSGILFLEGSPLECFNILLSRYEIKNVFCNRDYEPAAINRDKTIAEFLKTREIPFYDFKDQVIFDKNDIVKNDLSPYTVYTPYSRKWKDLLAPGDYTPSHPDISGLLKWHAAPVPALTQIGFRKTDICFVKPEPDVAIIKEYATFRDYPALDRTSHLGMALRFGTISVRECVTYALQYSEVWLNELIWREFFMQILYHFPHVVDRCFKADYEFIPWRNHEAEFQLWCEGRTGYPMVDAGMRQLNQTGYMHNRVRMITASFLTKHLLIDWRWGEAYFAQKLLDYDLAANNGNWQWAAGCGCDAAPYFRIFNPEEQLKKFDKDLVYVRRWHPGFENILTNPPMVAHAFARDRALDTYKKGLNSVRNQ